MSDAKTESIQPPIKSLGGHTDVFDKAAYMGFGDIHFKHDAESGLRAIIAIHNTNLGPALGGCRYVPYPSTEAALADVMNLSRAMSYKAAMAGLPLGGGKAVIIKPEHSQDREKLFEAYGSFVDELGGRYISSVDSGTGTADMDIASRKTAYVRSTSDRGDPSPSTAFGVRRGIEASIKHLMKRDDLEGVHVAIQGTGHVGFYLAQELFAMGAKLTVCDINTESLQRCADEFNATIVAPEEIHKVSCDVFAPCALGGVINATTINELNCKAVAGAANNALAEGALADALMKKGILYAPDYVINAGGLMQVWITDEAELNEKVSNIYTTLINLFERSERQNLSPAIVADHMAEEIIYG